MGKKDRTGNRKTRDQRKRFKVPELGYYLIVTDTEATERCFFNGLHQALPEDVRNKLVIKVVETKTRTMIDKCLELTVYDAQYRIPWIVFDRDQVQGFDEIIKEAEDKGIQVGWSNPCFEIWLYAYFGSMPAIQDSWICCSDFGRVYENKTGQKYSKADEQMYGKICKAGDETTVTIDFGDGRTAEYDTSQLDMLDLGYASTIHKSQGSEYRSVIINLQCAHYVMLTRPLVYTAITRGKENVIIVGERRALCMAIKKTDTEKRGTCLAKRLQAAMQ